MCQFESFLELNLMCKEHEVDEARYKESARAFN